MSRRYVSQFRSLIANRYDAGSAPAERLSGLSAAPALHRAGRAARLRPRRVLRARVHGASRSCCCWATTSISRSDPDRRCAQQLIGLAPPRRMRRAAVQATREHLIGRLRHAQRAAPWRTGRAYTRSSGSSRSRRVSQAETGAAHAGPARGALPVLLRHARAHAAPSSTSSRSQMARRRARRRRSS